MLTRVDYLMLLFKELYLDRRRGVRCMKCDSLGAGTCSMIEADVIRSQENEGRTLIADRAEVKWNCVSITVYKTLCFQ